MKPCRLAFAAATIPLVLTLPAAAQDWSYDVTTYMWFPDTTTTLSTPRGPASSELSAGDALKNLDAGLMLSVAARNGKWSLIGDLLYLDVDGDAPSPFGLAFSKIAAESKLISASGYALYRVAEDADYGLDLGVGLRAMRSDLTMDFRPGILAGETFKITDNWIDPLIGLRYTARLNDDWTAGVSLDYGGFGIGSASDETWQAVVSVGYKLNDRWTLMGGYRHLKVDRESDGVPYDLEMSGPVLGATLRF